MKYLNLLFPLFLGVTLSGCLTRTANEDMAAELEGTKAVKGCSEKVPDRTASGLGGIAAQDGLQKVHKNVLKGVMKQKEWTWPTTKKTGWRGFGVISTSLEKKNGGHEGVDIGVGLNTPVFAAAAGKIAYVLTGCPQSGGHTLDGWCGNGWGNHIVVDHGDGVFTRYAHLTSSKVVVNQTVKKGEQIGNSGTTGLSDGPHLHFELGYQAAHPFKPCVAPQGFGQRNHYKDGEGVYDPKFLAYGKKAVLPKSVANQDVKDEEMSDAMSQVKTEPGELAIEPNSDSEGRM